MVCKIYFIIASIFFIANYNFSRVYFTYASNTSNNATIAIPDQFKLYQNYSKLFNPSSIFFYALPKASRVILKVYNLLCEEVGTLVDEAREEGFYAINFDASGLALGGYLFKVKKGKLILSESRHY